MTLNENKGGFLCEGGAVGDGWCYCTDLCGEHWETAASRDEAINAALKNRKGVGPVRIGTTRRVSYKDVTEGVGDIIQDHLVVMADELMEDSDNFYPGFLDSKELENLITKYLDTKFSQPCYFVVENEEEVDSFHEAIMADPSKTVKIQESNWVQVTGLEVLSKKIDELEKKLAATISIHEMYALMCNGSVEAVYRSAQEADEAVKKKHQVNLVFDTRKYSYYVANCLVMEQEHPSQHYWIVGSVTEATHLMVP